MGTRRCGRAEPALRNEARGRGRVVGGAVGDVYFWQGPGGWQRRNRRDGAADKHEPCYPAPRPDALGCSAAPAPPAAARRRSSPASSTARSPPPPAAVLRRPPPPPARRSRAWPSSVARAPPPPSTVPCLLPPPPTIPAAAAVAAAVPRAAAAAATRPGAPPAPTPFPAGPPTTALAVGRSRAGGGGGAEPCRRSVGAVPTVGGSRAGGGDGSEPCRRWVGAVPVAAVGRSRAGSGSEPGRRRRVAAVPAVGRLAWRQVVEAAVAAVTAGGGERATPHFACATRAGRRGGAGCCAVWRSGGGELASTWDGGSCPLS